MRSSSILALAASLSTANAIYKGFNYGSTQTDDSAKAQSDFQSEFATAKALVGTSGFTSARLYTTIQAGTVNDPILAIPAAIAESTQLLLGMWASGGDEDFANELTALKSALTTYPDFASLVIGISVGSEDLYRISPTGVEALAGVGAEPATIVDYISQVRTAIEGTTLSAVPVGHVDTWTAWVNGSNDAVISASDWIGVDAYPYFQNTMSNGIDVGASLLEQAYQNTLDVSSGKDVWITETGWPVSGPEENLAVASLANAKTYWDQVGCDFAFDKINTFWYTLQDAYPTTPSPSFGIVGTTLSTTPLFNLTCPAASSSTSAVASSTTAAASSSTAVTVDAQSSSISTSEAASATGGVGLSPSEGAGNGVASSAVSVAATSAPTTASTASTIVSAVSSAVTVAAGNTSLVTSGSAVATTTAVSATGAVTSAQATTSTYTGAAPLATGSFIGAVGVLIAVVAAL